MSTSPRRQAGAAIRREAYLQECRRLAREALAEDIGTGDVTSALFGPDARGTAWFLAKQDGVVSGMELIRAVFRELDPSARLTVRIRDGEAFRKGESSLAHRLVHSFKGSALNICAPGLAAVCREIEVRIRTMGMVTVVTEDLHRIRDAFASTKLAWHQWQKETTNAGN